ncbi:MAG: hypothetical protein HY360_19720 [Verrucomicrobia bacterium]|nr:hypothetical protein [Verrucomicrobiota bacterium]
MLNLDQKEDVKTNSRRLSSAPPPVWQAGNPEQPVVRQKERWMKNFVAAWSRELTGAAVCFHADLDVAHQIMKP